MDERSIWSRAFGGHSTNDRSAAERDEFDALTEVADRQGVQWRDLTQPGYRVAGDRTVGGLTVSFDWVWRTRELHRRIAAKAEVDDERR